MAEFLDVLDGDGNPTGATAEKDDAHARGLWHQVSYIWVVNSRGELLMGRRSALKKERKHWWTYSALGHVQAGETPAAGAVREIKEEIGIDVKESELKLLRITKKSEKKEFVHAFVVRRDLPVENYVVDPREIEAIKYVPWQDLAKLSDREMTAKKIYAAPDFKELFDMLRSGA